MADEVRLIDANALRLMKIAECAGHTIEFAAGWKACVEYCKNNAPAIEAEPVKHGRWEINCDGYYPYCSSCKNEPQGREMTLYCPNCGAKMDLKRNDER